MLEEKIKELDEELQTYIKKLENYEKAWLKLKKYLKEIYKINANYLSNAIDITGKNRIEPYAWVDGFVSGIRNSYNEMLELDFECNLCDKAKWIDDKKKRRMILK